MTTTKFKGIVFAVLAVLVLIAFVWLFGSELWAAFTSQPQALSDAARTVAAASEVDDPRTYITTAVAALVGGVAAVYLGVEGAKTGLALAEWSAADYIRVAYVAIYVLFGSAAIVAWVIHEGDTALTLKNLAVTFIGLVSPAVAAYLGAKQQTANAARPV